MTVLLLAVAILGVSASGPLMAATTAPALAIAFWRNATATVLLAPAALTRGRPELVGLTRRHWTVVVFAGVMLAAHFATWISSLKLTSVAAAIALISMQVLWVVLIDILRGVWPGPGVLVGCVLAIAGVFVITGVDLSLSREALLGDGLALAGGLFAALYVVAGARARETLGTTTYTFLVYGVCAATLLVACVLSGVQLGGFSARDWALIAAVTVCAQFLGHSIINHLLAVMTPVVISLALLLEVPVGAMLAAVFLGEALPWATYGGLVLILAGLAVVTLARGRRQPTETLVGD
ncbi:DMT family transporter [Aeromicrobium phragmitis]|uniref:DMT family transporter n=1 Tax=Aeromicrobium phragmitis TaxID=2478914 RepID=A0A3L8PHI5_9ACTN|nr:DMT family transporter [Aeromicrobium phragmitis]RLV54695.1 DMT family transporter [Aeromicrobium phragmitis]